MTEKNIFVCKFFFIKYFKFYFTFYVKIATPCERSPPVSQKNLSKN